MSDKSTEINSIVAQHQRLNAIIQAMAVKTSLNNEMNRRIASINSCEDADADKLLSYAEGIVENVKSMDPQFPELKGFEYASSLVGALADLVEKNTDENGKLTVNASEILKWIEPLVMLNAKMTFLLSLKA